MGVIRKFDVVQGHGIMTQETQLWNTYLMVMNKSATRNQKMRKMMTLGLQTRKFCPK